MPDLFETVAVGDRVAKVTRNFSVPKITIAPVQKVTKRQITVHGRIYRRTDGMSMGYRSIFGTVRPATKDELEKHDAAVAAKKRQDEAGQALYQARIDIESRMNAALTKAGNPFAVNFRATGETPEATAWTISLGELDEQQAWAVIEKLTGVKP